MRRLIFTLILAGCFGVAGFAGADPMVLTSGGHLYKVQSADAGLVLSLSGPDIDDWEAIVPQTHGLSSEGVVLVVDEATATPYILWADTVDDFSSIYFAALVDGAWYGPVVLAGDDGTTVSNPHAMIHTARTVVDFDDADRPIFMETTFLHTVWWRHDNVTALGHAMFSPIPLDEYGMPLMEDAAIYDLENLLPYGFGCDDNPDVAGLTSARFFIGDGGQPQLFTPDFADCVFQLLGIEYEVVEEDIPGTGEKRRRHISVFNAGDVVMAIPPNIMLENAKMFLGHDSSVLIYWDAPDAVEWLLSDTEGWTEVRRLPLDDDVTHERAVELLRVLAR